MFASIAREAGLIGVTVQPAKCQPIYFHSDTHPLALVPGLLQFVADTRMLLQTDAAWLLGAPIGRTQKAQQRCWRVGWATSSPSWRP